MTEPTESPWMSFDEASAFLTLPEVEVARLLLQGAWRFEVVKVTPSPDFVLRQDVRIYADDVNAYQVLRWGPARVVKADELCNRAAMKFGHHPTRTTPGVRGPAKRPPKTEV